MSKKSRMMVWVALLAAMVLVPALGFAQDGAAPAAGGSGELVMEEGAAAEAPAGGMGLWAVIAGSGWLGIVLWMALLACSIAAAWLAIDFFITVNPKKIIPDSLVNDVREAMEQGDVMKALQRCEQDPGSLSAILMAGFRNVKEGFEVIQEQVGAAADLESEKLMQRVSYLNMCGSIAPDARAARHGARHDHGVRQPGQHPGRRGPAVHAGHEHRPGPVDDRRRPVRGHPGRGVVLHLFQELPVPHHPEHGRPHEMDLIKALRNVEVVEE